MKTYTIKEIHGIINEELEDREEFQDEMKDGKLTYKAMVLREEITTLLNLKKRFSE